MASTKKSSVAAKLRNLTATRFSAEQKQVIAETVQWLRETKKAGEPTPTYPAVSAMLESDYGIRLSPSAIANRVNG